jgi:hypothetical protein
VAKGAGFCKLLILQLCKLSELLTSSPFHRHPPTRVKRACFVIGTALTVNIIYVYLDNNIYIT